MGSHKKLNTLRPYQAKVEFLALKEEVEKLRAAGHKNIHYLSTDYLIGSDEEATVDGIHLTDLGFVRLAEKLYEKIKEINP